MNFNLAVILRETADASPGKAVVIDAGGQMTYGELDTLSDRLAAGLEAAGLRPGAAVALQLPNIAQFLVAYFGDPQGRRRGRAAERAAQGAGGGVLPRR